MKKTVIMMLAILTVATFASAQDYKQAAKNKAIEVQFAPLGGSPISIGGLMFRMYSSETKAMRANIFLGIANSTKVTAQKNNPTDSLEQKTKMSSIEFGLMPGMEMHMAGTDRLSPYWGAGIDFGIKMATKKEEMAVADATTGKFALQTLTTKGDGGWVRFGLGAFFGCDYFFAKKIYVGAECGLGFGLTKMSTIKKTTTVSGAPAIADEKQGSEMNFGPTVNSKLRVGWVF